MPCVYLCNQGPASSHLCLCVPGKLQAFDIFQRSQKNIFESEILEHFYEGLSLPVQFSYLCLRVPSKVRSAIISQRTPKITRE